MSRAHAVVCDPLIVAVREEVGADSDFRILRFRLQHVAKGTASRDEVDSVSRQARQIAAIVVDYVLADLAKG